MKATILISILGLASLVSQAQTQPQFEYTTKDNPPLVNNGKAIPVAPAFDAPFKVVSDTPCYMYKKNGVVVVNCPGVWFPPEVNDKSQNRQTRDDINENIDIQTSGSYLGYYPQSRNIDVKVPENATPAYPSGAYTPLTNEAPCYTYKTKKGLEVMECHGLWFPPEH